MNPNCWDSSAAGHVDAGEDYLACAIRELEEELGIVVPGNALHEFWQRQPSEKNGFEHQRFFVLTTDQALTPCTREIADGRWLTVEAMDNWVESDDAVLTLDLKLAWPVYRSWLTEQRHQSHSC